MLNALELLKSGYYVTPTILNHRIVSFFATLYPLQTSHMLIRLGGSSDGAYLLPDDLTGIIANFSPGTGSSILFEKELYEYAGIQSHLLDPTVEHPRHHPCIGSFQPKYLGPYTDRSSICLADWVMTTYNEHTNLDFMAQIDIEGDEYLTLLTVPSELLAKFRIIIVEFHSVYSWASIDFFPTIQKLFSRILDFFYVAHLHANNNDEFVNLPCGPCPRTLEITFHRRDRVQLPGPTSILPHDLDILNNPEKPYVHIPQYWNTSI